MLLMAHCATFADNPSELGVGVEKNARVSIAWQRTMLIGLALSWQTLAAPIGFEEMESSVKYRKPSQGSIQIDDPEA